VGDSRGLLLVVVKAMLPQSYRAGIPFDSGHAGSWCLPSRALVLTGLLLHRQPSGTFEGERA